MQLLLQPCSPPHIFQQAKGVEQCCTCKLRPARANSKAVVRHDLAGRQAVERGYPAPGRLWPVAEAIAVLARPVTQVQTHAGSLVLDAQSSKGACPHIYCLLKWEVWVHLTLNITCGDRVSSSIVVYTRLMHKRNCWNAMYTHQITIKHGTNSADCLSCQQ